MHLTCVVAARPNFMKIAPILAAASRYPDLTCQLVHTGQHYDERMSDLFFSELRLPKPDRLDHGRGVGESEHAIRKDRRRSSSGVPVGVEQRQEG